MAAVALAPLLLNPWTLPIVCGVGAICLGGIFIYQHFTRPAPSPPRSPSPGITQEQLIQSAQEKQGMDAKSHYNFAVCGCSGTGKSTFINCIRGVDDVSTDNKSEYAPDGPAPIDINEATRKAARYCWPNNQYPYLSIWDLPGGNTQKHPAKTYFEDKVLYAFDCLLLLKYGRFTQLDIDIYRKAYEYHIPIAIVMTKTDIDLENEAKLKFRVKSFKKLGENERKIVIERTTRKLKEEVKNELVQAKCSEPLDNSMYVVAAQSYRDEKHGLLEKDDYPPLETEKLFKACCTIALYRRAPQLFNVYQ